MTDNRADKNFIVFKLLRRLLRRLPLSKGAASFGYNSIYALECTFARQRIQKGILGVIEGLRPMGSQSLGLVRIGNPEGDGGYVMLDCFQSTNVAYSLGIGSDVSWDLALAERGGTIFQYDYSIERPPIEHPCFHFFRIAVSGKHRPGSKTISEILIDNGHADVTDIILKMDIEGSEWDLFDLMDRSELLKFRQISCELHDVASPKHLARTLRVLNKICSDFYCVHLHANNAQSLKDLYGLQIPNLLEATFVRKSDMPGDVVPGSMRRDLDRPNVAGLPEIDLSHLWP
jgi:hypothetical protein